MKKAMEILETVGLAMIVVSMAAAALGALVYVVMFIIAIIR